MVGESEKIESGCIKRVRMPRPTICARMPTVRNGKYSRNQPACFALRKVQSRLSSSSRGWRPRTQSSSRRGTSAREVGEWQVEEDAVLVGAHLLAHDRDEEVDENPGCANKGKPEEQNPVVPVAYQDVVLQAFHDR